MEEVRTAHDRSVVRSENVDRLLHRADDFEIRLRLETDMRIADLDENPRPGLVRRPVFCCGETRFTGACMPPDKINKVTAPSNAKYFSWSCCV